MFRIAIATGFAACSSLPAAARQPNVIVILSDDAGYADFGFTEGTLVPTPNLDRLARDGVFCSQGYVTASTCTPSRMGLMSGRYQQRFGAECNFPTIHHVGIHGRASARQPSRRTRA